MAGGDWPRARWVALPAIGRQRRHHSITSSNFSCGFPLLIEIDRTALSYQLFDLNLATRPAGLFFIVAGLSFEAGVLRTLSLVNCFPLLNEQSVPTLLFDRRVDAVRTMSGYPSIATAERTLRHVPVGPCMDGARGARGI